MDSEKGPFRKRVQHHLKQLLRRAPLPKRFRPSHAGHDTNNTSTDSNNEHHDTTSRSIQHDREIHHPSGKNKKKKRLSTRQMTDRIIGLHNKILRRNSSNKAQSPASQPEQHDSSKETRQKIPEHQEEELEEEDDDDDDGLEDMKQALCGCGRPLKAGWFCSNCRLVCPTCHRALGQGEQCSRCQIDTGGGNDGNPTTTTTITSAAGTAPSSSTSR